MSMIQTGKLQLRTDEPQARTGGDVSTFTQVNFPTPFPAGSEVIVVPMTQTFNGPETPGIRIADVTVNGFKIRFNEVRMGTQGSDGRHVEETVGWIAGTT
ncbi:hypothetical protein ACFCV8_06030 [Streptomyces sp. NPDC056347]|uniref:hypothetical protein n=1 Tax=Streptomyces sp. NPDC056347 TaxID=3345790 RepID=UPI0035E1C2D0